MCTAAHMDTGHIQALRHRAWTAGAAKGELLGVLCTAQGAYSFGREAMQQLGMQCCFCERLLHNSYLCCLSV
jgi:hypothetical protein